MHAIKLSEENLRKIVDLTLSSLELNMLSTYLKSKTSWYVVRGYVDPHGEVKNQVVLPAYIFPSNFDYDPIKIKTDWDQIVRK